MWRELVHLWSCEGKSVLFPFLSSCLIILCWDYIPVWPDNWESSEEVSRILLSVTFMSATDSICDTFQTFWSSLLSFYVQSDFSDATAFQFCTCFNRALLDQDHPYILICSTRRDFQFGNNNTCNTQTFDQTDRNRENQLQGNSIPSPRCLNLAQSKMATSRYLQLSRLFTLCHHVLCLKPWVFLSENSFFTSVMFDNILPGFSTHRSEQLQWLWSRQLHQFYQHEDSGISPVTYFTSFLHSDSDSRSCQVRSTEPQKTRCRQIQFQLWRGKAFLRAKITFLRNEKRECRS